MFAGRCMDTSGRISYTELESMNLISDRHLERSKKQTRKKMFLKTKNKMD